MTLLFAIVFLVVLGLLLRADRVVYYPNEVEQPRWLDYAEDSAAMEQLESVAGHLSKDAAGKWYFWDETLSSCCGPHPSRADAEEALDRYAKHLLKEVGRLPRFQAWLKVKFPNSVHLGATRLVILTKTRAFKLPSLWSWKHFLEGLLANMQEKVFSDAKWPELCPVTFYIPGGFLSVMPRTVPLSDHEWEVFDYSTFVDREDYVIPAEDKRDSFGVLRGRLVAIDYGS